MNGFWICVMVLALLGWMMVVIRLGLKHQLDVLERRNGAGSAERFAQLEQRIANLETILLDREKKESFDEALK